MRITVPDEIMRLTVPTCTPSRDNPLVIVSSLEVGGPDLHIFVSVLSVLQVGCQRDSLQEQVAILNIGFEEFNVAVFTLVLCTWHI